MKLEELRQLDALLTKFHEEQGIGKNQPYSAQSYHNMRLDVMEQVEGALQSRFREDGYVLPIECGCNNAETHRKPQGCVPFKTT